MDADLKTDFRDELDEVGLLDAARRAQSSQDWSEAERLWRQVMEQSPLLEDAWYSLATVLRKQKQYVEVEKLLSSAQDRFPTNKAIAELRCWNLMDLGEWANAETGWNKFLKDFPSAPGGYVGLSYVLRRGSRTAELDLSLSRARELHPDHRDIALLYASIPAMKRDWAGAADRHRELRRDFPHIQGAVTPLVQALRHLGLFDEIRQVLAEACRQTPRSSEFAIAFARFLADQQEWPEAISRWDSVITHFPDLPEGHIGMFRALKGAGFKTLRDMFIERAATSFPDDASIISEHAQLYVDRQDWASAKSQLEILVDRFPSSAKNLSNLGFVLLMSGSPLQAETLLHDALKQFPNNPEILINLARSSSAQSDWREAVRRWTTLTEKYPTSQLAKWELGVARYNLDLLDDDSEAVSSLDDDGPVSDVLDQDGRTRRDNIAIVTKFESLGADCEFGLFQREIGAEPLGLLRFAGTSAEQLIAALASRFEGIGASEHTELLVARGEYLSRDKRFGMSMHTHINPDTAEFDATYEMLLRKLKFLKRELIDSLESGETIFVFNDRWDQMIPRINELRAALDLYGKPKVLVVSLQLPGRPNGHIEVVDDNTMIGYIDKHGHDEIRWNISTDSWLTLCRKACEHWGILA